MEELKKLLRMNLQEFSTKDDPGDGGQGGDDPGDQGQGDGGTGGDDPGTGDEPVKKDGEPKDPKVEFTPEQQAVVDAIIKDRLDRERKAQEKKEQSVRDEAEQKRLKENEQYKDLADKLQAQLDTQKAENLKTKKAQMLTKAGYKEDQIERFSKYLEGDTDEDLQQSLDKLKADIPPAKEYADPGAGNGARKTPPKTGGEDIGKSVFERLKGKGKIRY